MSAASNIVGTPAPAANDNGANAAWEQRLIAVPADWYETAPAARRWLLRDGRRPNRDGVLPLGKAGQFAAAGGAGKTQILLQLAIAVATGTRWLETFEVETRGRVLVIMGEEDPEEARRRVHRAVEQCGVRPDEGMLVTLPLCGLPVDMVEHDARGNASDGAFLKWLRTVLSRHDDWSLIIVDPLSRFAGRDAEKDNAAATQFVNRVESIVNQTGATVLVAHHTNQTSRGDSRARGTANDARGVTGLVDGFRWQSLMYVDRIEGFGDLVTLRFGKSNYSRPWDDLLLERDDDGVLLWIDEDGIARLDAARAATDAERQKRRATKAAERAATQEADRLSAIRAIVAGKPGIIAGKLRDGLRAEVGPVGKEAFAKLVAEAVRDGWLRTEKGENNSTCHFLTELF